MRPSTQPGATASKPRVSIVIPTRNGAGTLPAVLDAVARQRVDWPFEIVAIDSASTDGTPDLLRSRVDRLIQMPAGAFNHGLTRNAGIDAALGELIVLLVQDAVPAADDWLAELTTPLFADPRLAGTFARQRPRDDASAVTRYYLDRWVAASDTPRVTAISSAEAFAALGPMDQFLLCVFDNVCACVRRSVWGSHPFQPTAIGEDVEWAREVLLAGYCLAYVPSAVVIHSHDRTARDQFERTRILHRRLFELFGLQTIPTLPDLARSIASSVRLHWRLERAAPSASGHATLRRRAIALAVAWPLGQYLGARSAVKGWPARTSRTV